MYVYIDIDNETKFPSYFYQKKHLEFAPNEILRLCKFLMTQCRQDSSEEALNALSFLLFNAGGRCAALQAELVDLLGELSKQSNKVISHTLPERPTTSSSTSSRAEASVLGLRKI